jgi:hypothetical protein
MTRGTIITIVLAIVGGGALNLALYSIAHAGGPSAIATVAAFAPLEWDWVQIFGIAVTVLGGLIMALRPIAALTAWKGDNWLLAKLEWLLATILKVFTPRGAGFAGIGLGNGKGGVGDQPSPPPPPFASGGKSGGGAS